MIKPGWVRFKTDPQTVCMANIIDHICQPAGNANHCGIATDLDGGFGKEQCTRDFTTIADLQQMAPILSDRGYSDADITGIMSQNFLNFFRRAWS